MKCVFCNNEVNQIDNFCSQCGARQKPTAGVIFTSGAFPIIPFMFMPFMMNMPPFCNNNITALYEMGKNYYNSNEAK